MHMYHDQKHKIQAGPIPTVQQEVCDLESQPALYFKKLLLQI